MKKHISKFIVTIFAAGSLISCDGFLDTRPSNELSDGSVFTSLEGAQLVLIGAYDWMTDGWNSHYTNQYIFFHPDLAGDDAFVSPYNNYNRFVDLYQYNTTASNNSVRDSWGNCYSVIDNCNAILDNIHSLPESNERDRIEAEALTLRAYCYHFLVRAFAKPVATHGSSKGVVLRLTSSIDGMPRATVSELYSQMTEDLQNAVNLFSAPSSQKSYLDKRGAHAMLARYYLDLKDETNGIRHARAALEGLTLMNEEQYLSVFTENNTETIWSFECTADDNQFYLSLPSFWYMSSGYNEDTGEYSDVVLGYSSLRVSENLIDLFEEDDVRRNFFPLTNKGNYVRYPAPVDASRGGGIVTTKIDSRNNAMGQGAINYLRGSEMYLIIAELAADNSNFDTAREALNTLRAARGASPYTGADGADLIDEIQRERRRELFAEGHRLFDLKRRNLPLVRQGVEGHDLWESQLNLPAGSDRFELPIPQEEIDANEELTDLDQNPHYQ